MRYVARRPRLRPVSRHLTEVSHWQLGLRAAQKLRHCFPDYWEAMVADRPARYETLYGIGAAFIALAFLRLEFDDWGMDRYGDLTSANLDRVLDEPFTELANGEDFWDLLRHFLNNPPLMVYGLDIHTEEADEDDYPPLALALTLLTGSPFFSESDLAHLLGVDGEDSPKWDLFEAIACMLPRIHCTQDGFDRLCAELRGTTWRGIDLGAVLAFSHQRTDNYFANVGYFEATDARVYYGGNWEDFSWEDEPFEVVVRKQGEARDLRNAFYRLDDHITANPDILTDEIADEIAQAATRIGLRVTWPHDEEPHDDANAHEDEGSAAPEAEEATALAAP